MEKEYVAGHDQVTVTVVLSESAHAVVDLVFRYSQLMSVGFGLEDCSPDFLPHFRYYNPRLQNPRSTVVMSVTYTTYPMHSFPLQHGPWVVR